MGAFKAGSTHVVAWFLPVAKTAEVQLDQLRAWRKKEHESVPPSLVLQPLRNSSSFYLLWAKWGAGRQGPVSHVQIDL